MPQYIVEISKGRYLEWSTIVDAPLTYGVPLEEFKRYYIEQYGKVQAELLEQRLERVKRNGTSAIPAQSVEQLVSGNKAGPKGSSLTLAQLRKKYVR